MMNFNFMPSLEYAALVKIASTLWNQDDISDLIANFPSPSQPVSEIPDEQRDKVIEKISLLQLPELLEKELIGLVNPIGLGILNWRLYHVNHLPREFVDASLHKLCWTQRGTVDRKRTAEVLVKDENTRITTRYRLALIYCLHNDISALWDKMCQSVKDTCDSEDHPPDDDQNGIEVIWACDLKGKVNESSFYTSKFFGWQIQSYRYRFNKAALSANRIAAEYFFPRLSPEEKKDFFTRFITNMRASNSTLRVLDSGIPREYFADLLCFLLSEMTEEQQTRVFKFHSSEILLLFLEWPLQHLFVRLANSVWTFLSPENYHHLLSAVVTRVQMDGPKDFDYQKLLGEFWQQSPNSHKKYVINNPKLACALLMDLFRVGDKNNISLILNEASAPEKEGIIDSGMAICDMLARNNKLNLLDFFVGECITSKNVSNKLIKHILHSLEETPKRKGATCTRSFKKLNQKGAKKRKADEESIRRSKRLRNKKSAN